MLRIEGEVTKSQLPTYGCTIEEILSSCVTREQKWNEITRYSSDPHFPQSDFITLSEEITESMLADN